jgi:hypothetical protein
MEKRRSVGSPYGEGRPSRCVIELAIEDISPGGLQLSMSAVYRASRQMDDRAA